MSDKICVNLCTPTDETPARPTKRIRPEVPVPKVLSLVDSDDDSPSVISQRRSQAVQAAERHPRMTAPWGAIEDQQVAPRSMVDPAPSFRPPSARYRRLPVAHQPYMNTNPSPIVIEDDDDDGDSNAHPTSLFRLLSSSTRQHGSGMNAGSNGLVSSALQSRAAAAAAVPGLVPTGDGFRVPPPQPQQLQQQGAQQQQQEYHQWQGQDEPGGQRRLSLQLLQHQLEQQQSPRPSVLVARPLRRLPRPATDSDAQSNGPTQIPSTQQQQQQSQPQSHQQSVQQGLSQGTVAGDQEDTDLRLAATLQAEEDERLARETARRLENEEHRRMMSRLDMLETLESANLAATEAAMATRRALAAAERGRRNDRVERLLRFGGGGGPDRDNQALRGMASQRGSIGLPRPGRAPGAGSLANLLGADAEDAALAAAMASGEEQSAAAAAAAEVGIGRRWNSRSLHDLIPAMMAMPMPLGFHRFLGGRGDADDGPGAQQAASRRARHAAYREHVTAMREQLVAAQRAGIPPHLLLSDRDFTPEDYELLCRLDERVENRKGAKDEQLAALPTETVGTEGRRRSDGCLATCTICMEEVAPGDVLKRLPCLHEFHGDCVDTWLKTKACCPICQRGLDA
ncbi:hypothetical protein PLESTB_000818300 [Pleodorina starrii]|uniref:RING-type domain-containing protein n=1 Tax=Pleodorina starrii TaxID=330485 RepID=A0A9W6BMD6_9CHLO|nr:hypothetical protein PLESTB_000818300 [Pleodorina starrii]